MCCAMLAKCVIAFVTFPVGRCIEVQDVHGRTFGVWTLLTCLLCVMTALNLDNEALYLVTFLSFVVALGYFLIECFVYHTMAVKSLASMFFFAGSSLTILRVSV